MEVCDVWPCVRSILRWFSESRERVRDALVECSLVKAPSSVKGISPSSSLFQEFLSLSLHQHLGPTGVETTVSNWDVVCVCRQEERIRVSCPLIATTCNPDHTCSADSGARSLVYPSPDRHALASSSESVVDGPSVHSSHPPLSGSTHAGSQQSAALASLSDGSFLPFCAPEGEQWRRAPATPSTAIEAQATLFILVHIWHLRSTEYSVVGIVWFVEQRIQQKPIQGASAAYFRFHLLDGFTTLLWRTNCAFQLLVHQWCVSNSAARSSGSLPCPWIYRFRRCRMFHSYSVFIYMAEL